MNTKKAIILGTLGSILIALASLWLINFLITEQVTVSASDPAAEIFIGQLGKSSEKKGNGSASLRLPPGSYNVQITKDGQETLTTFDLKKGSPVNLELKLEKLASAQHFANFAANNLLATNETVQFVWPGYNKLVILEPKTGFLKPINGASGEYVEAIWVSSQQAYLRTANDTYRFFDGASTKQLPYSILPGSLSVASDGKVFYIDSGKVLVRPSAFANIEYEFEFSATQPVLVGGPQDRLLIYDTVIGAESSDEQAQPEVFIGKARSESATAALNNFDITGAAWSPNGSKLAISAADGLYVIDIESSKVTRLYNSYITHPETITWQDNDKLIFFMDQKIWRVSTNSNPIWTKLSQVDGSVNPADSFAISPDGKKLHFSTATSTLEGQIFTIPLND